jgi:hypothetical protein
MPLINLHQTTWIDGWEGIESSREQIKFSCRQIRLLGSLPGIGGRRRLRMHHCMGRRATDSWHLARSNHRRHAMEVARLIVADGSGTRCRLDSLGVGEVGGGGDGAGVASMVRGRLMGREGGNYT